jgi:sodium--glutamate symport carrier gltS
MEFILMDNTDNKKSNSPKLEESNLVHSFETPIEKNKKAVFAGEDDDRVIILSVIAFIVLMFIVGNYLPSLMSSIAGLLFTFIAGLFVSVILSASIIYFWDKYK